MITRPKIILTCTLAAILFSCAKKEQAAPAGPQEPTAPVQLSFRYYAGNNPTQFAYSYDVYDQLYVFDEFRFLVSNFRLIDDDGGMVAHFSSKAVAVDPSIAGFNIMATIGNSPYGHIAQIKFDIGLEPQLNAGTPESNSTAPLNDTTWWRGPSLGYKFIQASGRYDSDGNDYLNPGDGTWSFYYSGASALRTVTLPVSVEQGENGSTIALKVQLTGLIGSTPAYALGQMNQQGFMDRLQAAISVL